MNREFTDPPVRIAGSSVEPESAWFATKVWPVVAAEVEKGEPISVERWHWARYNSWGAQVDGSGPQINALKSRKEAEALVKKKYPDDHRMDQG